MRGCGAEIVYHTVDECHLESVLKFGLIPGGYRKKSGRIHTFFNTTPPWDEKAMKKLEGIDSSREENCDCI